MMRWATVVLLAVSLVSVQHASEVPAGEIGGAVRSAKTGEPLKSVQVSLRLLSGEGAVSKGTTTGPGGEFLFQDLPAGEYRLAFQKAGYLRLQGRSTQVRLLAGKATNLTFSLVPAGAISGTVLDSLGEPVPNADVRAYAVHYQTDDRSLIYRGRAQANEVGEYRIHGLQPGSYILRVSPPSTGAAAEFYADTACSYYPNASGPAQAQPVRLQAGQELENISPEFAGGPTYIVPGAVFEAATGAPCLDCTIRVLRIDEPYVLTIPVSARVAPRGTFVLRGLNPGLYRVAARKRRSDAAASLRLRVDEGNIDALALLRVGLAHAVSGKVVYEDAPEDLDTSGLAVTLTATLGALSWPMPETPVGVDSSFSIDGVPPETYRLHLERLPPGGYVKAVRIQGRELPSPRLTVSENAGLEGVEVVVGFDSATLGGGVKSGRDEEPVEARITLIPNERGSDFLEARNLVTDTGGYFEFRGLPPGSYTVFALPRSSAVEILDPIARQALRAYGRDLNLEAGANIAVDLNLAPDLTDPGRR